MSQNRCRISIFVIPFLVIAIAYVVVTTIFTFTFDKGDTSEELVVSGVTLQFIYLYLVVREIMITCYDWIRGRMFDFKLRYLRYTALCCLDGCLVLGTTIWTTVMLSAEECNSGCEQFKKVIHTNVVVGYIYYCLICCLPGPCIQLYNMHNAERWIQAALVEDFGQPVEDNDVELQ